MLMSRTLQLLAARLAHTREDYLLVGGRGKIYIMHAGHTTLLRSALHRRATSLQLFNQRKHPVPRFPKIVTHSHLVLLYMICTSMEPAARAETHWLDISFTAPWTRLIRRFTIFRSARLSPSCVASVSHHCANCSRHTATSRLDCTALHATSSDRHPRSPGVDCRRTTIAPSTAAVERWKRSFLVRFGRLSSANGDMLRHQLSSGHIRHTTVDSRGGRVRAGLWRASRWRGSQFPTNVTIHLIDQ
eukprot:COSAG01_NODE_1498_length_10117_cov_19.035536_7_plen_245_part_00